jgi:hypothetical protein
MSKGISILELILNRKRAEVLAQKGEEVLHM